MKEKQKFVEADKKLIEVFESEKKPYYTRLMGKTWLVLPGVFSPKYSPDAKYFCKWMPDMKGKKFLEIGSGTGIVAIESSLKGAKNVVCVDINPIAVKNSRMNAKRLKADISARQGSLFSCIKRGEKFDFIFFNLPFGYVRNKPKKMIERSVFDFNYNTQKEFMKIARKFLEPGGKILIGFSTIGHVSELRKNARKYGYSVKEIKSEKVHDTEGLHRFILFGLSPKK